MSILGVKSALAGTYQYANRTQKTGTNRTGFTEQLQKTGEGADTSKVDWMHIPNKPQPDNTGQASLVFCQNRKDENYDEDKVWRTNYRKRQSVGDRQ